ncbi:TIM-barrel domain-containing protein [Microbacterium suwonense]|uniref:Glycosyl hydrolase n=1 Tax=Microbacterium suwonense TaxID=683047 RepID=A0ABN6X7W9_9MICO|nr:TIM-barrel domain-containing protein [Microbacterium suwonense]BDZ39496.1 glycosyl hydrolase [Microbacterium suwonense]
MIFDSQDEFGDGGDAVMEPSPSPDGSGRTPIEHFEVDGASIVWRGDGEVLRVDPWGVDSVRVRATIKGQLEDTRYSLLDAAQTRAVVTVDGNTAELRNGRLVVRLTSWSGYGYQTGYEENRCRLSFHDADGTLLLEELSEGGALHRRARDWHPHLGGDFAVRASFTAHPDEKLYGMGQYQQDVLDIKGCTFELAHRNSQISIPFVISSRGYGMLWHNPAVGQATFADNVTQWSAESTRQLDYWVTAGVRPRDIVSSYADATGHPPAMPEYGLGYWQSKLRYWNQEQLLSVAREHVARGLPMDVIVADFFHWPHMGDYRFDEEFWPDPTAMVEELRELGIELMVSVWPQVSLNSENFAEMKKHNLLVRAERGIDVQMSFEGPSAFIDVTAQEGRDYLWRKLSANYGVHGIRLFWLDEAEPEYGVYDYDSYRYALGSGQQVGALYPQLFLRSIHDGSTAGGQETLSLVRAAWSGSQRYGALVWSGDIGSTWTALQQQITAGTHIGLAGIAWFTTDIGGFHSGDIEDPAFIELLLRWFQFGTFSPVMRMHGDRQPAEQVAAADGSRRLPSGAPNEVWSYGDAAYRIMREHILLRETLRDYLREVMAEASQSGLPAMRAMFLEFPDDAAVWDVKHQYLLGPDLLVAPVVEPGARQRRVYLPDGAVWLHSATGDEYAGAQWVTVPAPIEQIPVFVRADARPSALGIIRRDPPADA